MDAIEVAGLTHPPQSWLEQYGPIGFVAFVAIASLGLGVKYYLADKREREKREEAQRAALQALIDQQRASLDALNREMVKLVQSAHDETLTLLHQQRDDHEKRFQSLLERHMTMTEKWAEKTQEIATVVSKTIESLSKKLRDGG